MSFYYKNAKRKLFFIRIKVSYLKLENGLYTKSLEILDKFNKFDIIMYRA